MTIPSVGKYLNSRGHSMDIREARHLASQTAIWYHQNNIGSKLQKIAAPKKDPRFSDEVWARLMAEAILSFSNGLDGIDSDRSRVAIKDLHDQAQMLVGEEAFQSIAMIVSAASANRLINASTEEGMES